MDAQPDYVNRRPYDEFELWLHNINAHLSHAVHSKTPAAMTLAAQSCIHALESLLHEIELHETNQCRTIWRSATPASVGNGDASTTRADQ